MLANATSAELDAKNTSLSVMHDYL